MQWMKAKVYIYILICACGLLSAESCKAPTYKQLVGEWDILEFHLVQKDQNGKLMTDTTLLNCGEFVFYKVDDFSKKENKGKIKGYVEKPSLELINGTRVFLPQKSWFEGTARKPEMIGDDIEFWFSGLTRYTITERDGNTIKAHFDGGPSYQETIVIKKK